MVHRPRLVHHTCPMNNMQSSTGVEDVKHAAFDLTTQAATNIYTHTNKHHTMHIFITTCWPWVTLSTSCIKLHPLRPLAMMTWCGHVSSSVLATSRCSPPLGSPPSPRCRPRTCLSSAKAHETSTSVLPCITSRQHYL